MQLILILILFGVIGYMLAGSDFRERIDRTGERVSTASGGWWDRSKTWWRSRFSNRVSADEFKAWVTGPGADSLPENYKDWYVGLPENQAQDFVHSLADYADGLGYNLALLVAGGLEQKSVLKQVFVEAIVVYSDAYRKAKETKQVEAEEAPEDEKTDGDGVKPAQKSASRRKRQTVADAAETASAA